MPQKSDFCENGCDNNDSRGVISEKKDDITCPRATSPFKIWVTSSGNTVSDVTIPGND